MRFISRFGKLPFKKKSNKFRFLFKKKKNKATMNKDCLMK